MRYLIMASLAIVMTLAAFQTTRDFTVHGFILDSAGSPIPGALVCIKATNRCTSSAVDGSFSISIHAQKATLIVTSVGFEKLEIIVTDDGKALRLKMKMSTTALNEVVVTGYTSKKRKDIKEEEEEPARRQALTGAVVAIQEKSMGLASRSYKRKSDAYFKGQHHSDSDKLPFNTEDYDGISENRFLLADNTPLSTFSIDVDGASYANVRRYIDMGQLPPPGAVRIEELINYFHYDYPQPKGEDPFSINTEISDCPWQPANKLVLIGLQGRKIPIENLPASNLVFLIDVSGSMMEPNKLPLVQASLKLLVDQLREQDKVSLVVYAGNAGLVLPATSGAEKQKIKDAIDALEAGGSTAGGAGILLAYKVAKENFLKGANNRVILCTDGDFNVGLSSDAALEDLIGKERKSGVFLTVLGFGMGNYKDNKMQKLADKGNGNHSYIDRLDEARKVFVNEFGGTLFTIAKDVKLQVEFNPQKVQAYRLIGYENRILNKEDFNNDLKDAGELGSGHMVTALYEIIPVGVRSRFIEKSDPLKYQQKNKSTETAAGNEMLTIKFRYKKPDEDVSKLIEHPVVDQELRIRNSSANFRFASALAEFGMLLRNSEFREESGFESVEELAKTALGKDEEGYRHQFLGLVRNASDLAKNRPEKERSGKEELSGR